MIGVPIAHVGGFPIEETFGALGPALLVGLGVAWANLRSRLGRVCAHTCAISTDVSESFKTPVRSPAQNAVHGRDRDDARLGDRVRR
jgi:hypothetical protein